MSRSALSAKVFAVYMFIVGALLVIAPNVLLETFGMPSTKEIWISLVGVLVINLAALLWAAARRDDRYYLWLSVGTRTFFFVMATIFVVLGRAPAMLLLFGVIDLCGGGWTWFALQADARPAVASQR